MNTTVHGKTCPQCTLLLKKSVHVLRANVNGDKINESFPRKRITVLLTFCIYVKCVKIAFYKF
jgi:hypothetical protein